MWPDCEPINHERRGTIGRAIVAVEPFRAVCALVRRDRIKAWNPAASGAEASLRCDARQPSGARAGT